MRRDSWTWGKPESPRGAEVLGGRVGLEHHNGRPALRAPGVLPQGRRVAGGPPLPDEILDLRPRADAPEFLSPASGDREARWASVACCWPRPEARGGGPGGCYFDAEPCFWCFRSSICSVSVIASEEGLGERRGKSGCAIVNMCRRVWVHARLFAGRVCDVGRMRARWRWRT